jgi:hypothetical protein
MIAVKKFVREVETKLSENPGKDEVEIPLDRLADDEYYWFIGNDYLKYFLKDKAARTFEYIYSSNNKILTVKRDGLKN